MIPLYYLGFDLSGRKLQFSSGFHFNNSTLSAPDYYPVLYHRKMYISRLFDFIQD